MEEITPQIAEVPKKSLKEKIFGTKKVLLVIEDINLKKCPKCNKKLDKSKAEHTETSFKQAFKCKNIYCDFHKIVEFKK